MNPTAQPSTPSRPAVSVKSVAMPAQHGGWGFLIEPILAGLIAAPSWAGLFVGVAAFGVFLLHQPLKITFKDWRKGKRYARTRLAERFVLLYGGIALAGFVLASLLSDGVSWWLAIGLALPFAAVQLLYESRNESREALPEIAGAVAFGASATAILLIGGRDLLPALLVWLALAVRALASIIYVRARLRLEHDRPYTAAPTLVTHVLALAVVSGLVVGGWLSPWVIGAALLLLVRAVLGIFRPRRPTPPKVIGIRELVYGVIFAVAVGVGA